MKKIIHTTLCLLLFCSVSLAQNVQKSIEDLSHSTNAKITQNKTFGIAEFVKFPHDNPLELESNTVYDKVMTFLESYKGIFDLKNVESSFTLDTIKIDQYGFKHVTLLQTHQDVPIFDGKLKFHFNSEEKLTAINGNYIPNIKLNATPNISVAEAVSIAIATLNSQDVNHSGKSLLAKESTLYLFQKGLVQGYRGSNHLVYRIEVSNDLDVVEYVFVDAHNGDIIEQFTGIAHAIDRIVYEGDTSTIVWQEGDAFPGTLSIWQQNEVTASGHMYNLFKNTFGYISFDGFDAQMQIVNNLDAPGYCPNASWNGTTINFCDGTASDDVIGHEWAHAYTQYTNDLVYAWQSGAINEAYSDIWGETIDLLNNYEDADEDLSFRTGCNSSDRWMLSEDASAFGGAIRDMWDPTCKGDPGKVTDAEYYCDFGDNGGVHINSGIPNHAYALLVDGGTYNGQTITGIGFTKAAHIFWRAQSQYLTSSSDFASLADALEAACSDLMGINLEGLSTTEIPAGSSGEIITNADLNQVISTILAVELRTEICTEVTILDPLENELCAAATNNPIFFEDWEAGFGSWALEQLPVNSFTWTPRDWIIFNGPEANREGNVAYGPTTFDGNCQADDENGIIRLQSPLITLPNSTEGNFEMAFTHGIAMETDWDGGNIKYSLNGGNWNLIPTEAFTQNSYNDNSLRDSNNPLTGEPAFTGADFGTPLHWGTSVVDLSSIGVVANTTIQFRFEIGTDACGFDVGWGLDEIMVYNCASLSTNEFELEQSITVFPNPNNGMFTIKKVNSINLTKAVIHDINGRFIKTINLEGTQEKKTINISNVASGMYFLTVESENAKRVIKLIKE